MNQTYLDIIESIKNNDLEFTESLVSLAKHRSDLKVDFEFNFIDLIEKKTKDSFLKMFIWENGQWTFFDYGYLRKNKFFAHKSKLLLFEVLNIEFNLIRRPDSDNHVIVSGQQLYLLYSPYTQVIDMLFE